MTHEHGRLGKITFEKVDISEPRPENEKEHRFTVAEFDELMAALGKHASAEYSRPAQVQPIWPPNPSKGDPQGPPETPPGTTTGTPPVKNPPPGTTGPWCGIQSVNQLGENDYLVKYACRP